MVWWELDARTKRYDECLVYERLPDGEVCYRHWTASDCTAYDHHGNALPELSFGHPYGRVPIVRVFDERKSRTGNTGQSRYEVMAELQKAIYNSRSELILGDVNGSHPTLMMPEELIQRDGKIRVGPTGVIVMPLDGTGRHVESKYLDVPKGSQAAVREHIGDYSDEALADAEMLKPAGTTLGATVSQSGVSKAFDVQRGNDYLSEVSETLAEAERLAAEFALVVLFDGNPSEADLASVKVQYPREFALSSTAEIAATIYAIQQGASGMGAMPEVEKELIGRLVVAGLPGIDDDRKEALLDEVRARVDAAATRHTAEAGKVASNDDAPGARNFAPSITPA
jgi:hypothetical protein